VSEKGQTLRSRKPDCPRRELHRTSNAWLALQPRKVAKDSGSQELKLNPTAVGICAFYEARTLRPIQTIMGQLHEREAEAGRQCRFTFFLYCYCCMSNRCMQVRRCCLSASKYREDAEEPSDRKRSKSTLTPCGRETS